LARSLWDSNDFEKSLGILSIELSTDEITELFIESITGQLIYLVNQSNHALASNTESGVFLPSDLLRPSFGSFYPVTVDDEGYMARSDAVNESGLSLVSLIPVSIINDASNAAMIRITGAYAVILVFIALVIFLFSNKLLHRIRLLGNQMKNIGSGPQFLVVEDNSDEIGTLVKNYNSMVNELDELLVKQFELGQEKMGAEFKALQSQINPHFLYNTLDMLNWMALKKENENICDVINAMSRFYKLTLSKGDDVITLRDEIHMCGAYIEIQQRKFKGRVEFITDIEESALDCLLPKITLQPLIENAIVHGINERPDARGTVTVSGWTEAGSLVLSVTDNGVGMDEADKFKDNPNGSHYGIINIEKRLSLYFQKQISIKVESSQGIGTCVSFVIPLVYAGG
jgi:two-component system sensor histidine kinase YesM